MPVLDLEFNPTIYSFGLLGIVANFVRGRAGVTSADVDAWLADIELQNAKGTHFFSLDQYLFQATKPEDGAEI